MIATKSLSQRRLVALLRNALVTSAKRGVRDINAQTRVLASATPDSADCSTALRDGVVCFEARLRGSSESATVLLAQELDLALLAAGASGAPTLIWVDRWSMSDAQSPLEMLARGLWSMPFEQRPDEVIVYASGLHVQKPACDAQFALGLQRLHALDRPRRCHICGQGSRTPHYLFERLCVRCGDFNLGQRLRETSLSGRVALVTGGRIKIGYAVALRLLRAGAVVFVSTRFPGDAATRFAREHDAPLWLDRLRLVGADFRRLADIHKLIAEVSAATPHLDIVVNNAAQTVRMPEAQYRQLMLEEAPKLIAAGRLSTGATGPEEMALDHAHETHDPFVAMTGPNSWNRMLEATPAQEVFEAHVINAVAPAILCAELKPLLMRSPHRVRHIVNVSAPEGLFDADKSGWHVHTNMAKAALNMLTRSIAESYAGAGILVNSVDPGWVSDQMPRRTLRQREDAELRLPLTLTDAAARVCEPIADAESGVVYSGQMRRHYASVNW